MSAKMIFTNVNYVATVEQIPYGDAMQEIRNYVRFRS
jgi:hypothetical protein